MPKFNGLVLTDQGADLMAQALTQGVATPITRISVGDGQLETDVPFSKMSDMVHEVQSISQMRKTIIEKRVVQLDFSIRTSEIGEGFWFREIGIFAMHPTLGEILYAYENAGSIADYMPSLGGSTIVNRTVRVMVFVGDSAQVIINVSSMGNVILYTEEHISTENQNEFQLNELNPDSVISVNIDGVEYFAWKVVDGKIVFDDHLRAGQHVWFREVASGSGSLGGGEGGVAEIDPTVPDWAKEPSKPKYTASEVGAVPTTRKINGMELTEDLVIETGSDGNIAILGLYPDLDALIETHPFGAPGDAYSVGTEDNNVVYLWNVDTQSWVSIGKVQGRDGNVLYATFEPNFNDGNLYMITPKGYDGLGFQIDSETRQLEVVINEDSEPGTIGGSTGGIRTPLGEMFPILSGAYDETKAYGRFALVLYKGNSYASKQPCEGIAPDNADYWQPITATDSGDGDLSGLAKVATTGSYNDLKDTPALADVATSGNYIDLKNKPTIPTVPTLAAVATSGEYADLKNKPTIPTIPALAAVATSGSYDDLSNKPDLSGYVPATRTVNGKALSANITLAPADIGAVAASQIVITPTAPTEGAALAANTVVFVV